MVGGRGGKRGILWEEGRLWMRAPRPCWGGGARPQAELWSCGGDWMRGKFGVLGGNKAACRAEVELTSFTP